MGYQLGPDWALWATSWVPTGPYGLPAGPNAGRQGTAILHPDIVLQRSRPIYPDFESERRACAEPTWPHKCHLGLGGLIGPRAVASCRPFLQSPCHRHFGRDQHAHGAWAALDCTVPPKGALCSPAEAACSRGPVRRVVWALCIEPLMPLMHVSITTKRSACTVSGLLMLNECLRAHHGQHRQYQDHALVDVMNQPLPRVCWMLLNPVQLPIPCPLPCSSQNRRTHRTRHHTSPVESQGMGRLCSLLVALFPVVAAFL